MRLTAEQEEVVRAEGSVAVIAGAGTGKTHMLAARYLHHLTHHALSPLSVVAVTFTEAAAAELRARVRREAAALSGMSEDGLAELEAAPIGTLHALAARICREHPDAAGVGPAFTVLDELEGPLWLRERLEEALGTLPAALFARVPFSLTRSAMEAFVRDPLAAERALACDPAAWPGLVADARQKARERLLADPAWLEARAVLEAFRGREADRREQARRSALAAAKELQTGEWGQERSDARGPEGRALGADPRASMELLTGISLVGGSSKSWPDGGWEEVRDALAALRDLARAAAKRGLITLELGPADARLEAAIPALREAFQRVREHLARAKRRARVLDFADLEVHALRALESGAVREYYRERWKAFLVDEFQDTNPVQAELLERLTEGAILTIVGDEKQAIYGFRRADVTVFRRFRRRIAADGSRVPAQRVKELSVTFRTHTELVQRSNGLFAPILGDLRQDLRAHRTEPPHPGPHLRLYVVSEGGTREAGTASLRAQGPRSGGWATKARRQQVEARQIARLLREMLETPVMVHDPTTDRPRPIRPGDIALLSRAWEPLDLYGAALEAAGVPTAHAGGGSLLETREAKDGGALLRFLADPGDDLALAAVLRSPFFAVSDRTLFLFAGDRPGQAGWWGALEAGPPADLLGPSQLLTQLLDARRSEPPSRLLRMADRLTGYTAVLANLSEAARREADWRGFVDFVQALEHGTEDLFLVARRLRRLILAGADVPRPPLEASDAVALMSIHRAKGLEWPVVVIPDLSRATPGRAEPVHLDPQLGAALKLRDGGEGSDRPALYAILEARRKDREDDEARRLLYVAVTRARDHLILTASDEKGGNLDLLLPGLQSAGIETKPILFTAEESRPPLPPEPIPHTA